jgi:hypothetical protein
MFAGDGNLTGMVSALRESRGALGAPHRIQSLLPRAAISHTASTVSPRIA